MHELFLKARRFHEAGSDAYGNVLLLQVSHTTSYIRISPTFQSDFIKPSSNPPSGPPYKTTTNWLLSLLDRARPNP